MLRSSSFFLIVFLFIGQGLWAKAPVISLRTDEPEVKIGKSLELFNDESRLVTYEQVQSVPFMPSQEEVPNFGFNLANHWVRFTVRNDSKTANTWYLNLAWPILTEIDFFAPETTFYTGEKRLYSSRPIDNRNFVFPLDLKPGETKTYYMRIFTRTPNVYPLTIYTENGLVKSDELDMALIAIFFGACIIMLIYNTLLFATVRDTAYIPYILYLLITAVFMFSFRGLGFVYVWGDSPWLNAFTRVAFPNIAAFSLIIFIKRFLDTKHTTPIMHNLLSGFQVYSAIIFLMMCAQEVEILHIAADQLMNAGIGILPIMAFVTGIIVYRRGYKPAKFYLVAFSFLLIGLVVQILKNFNILTHNLFTEYTFQYGILLEQAILSIALGDKINLFKEEKEQAQEEAIGALKENEKLIAEQNRVLEQKVNERTQQLQGANLLLEEKNQDILDSINYARRIQTAILPAIAQIQKKLPHTEIFYRPKDIVSGDFFWYIEKGNKLFLAAVDCTGHGVPGAFMSVIGYNLLNRIVGEQGVLQPDKILYLLDAAMRETLHQDDVDSETKDGMDISLCAIDPATGVVEYAGANRPLWLLRYGELVEIKGDKYPIGGAQIADKVFTNQPIQPEPNDTFYIFSDGVVDQFGGEEEKKRKFGSKRLRELVLRIADRPLVNQRMVIEQEFDNWRGDTAQLDDVTFIVFKLKA
jgi:two-component system, sensor histidine kinase LadS